MNTSLMNYFTGQLRKRRDAEIQLQHLKEDLKGRELFLTPTGEEYKGLGPNDTDRGNVLQKRFAGDTVCQEIHGKIRLLEISLSTINASIDECEALRRNQEWEITRELTQVLQERYTGQNPGLKVATAEAINRAVSDAKEIYQAEQAVLNYEEIPF